MIANAYKHMTLATPSKVAGGVAPHHARDLLAPAEHPHSVQFYDDEQVLHDAASEFLRAGLAAGEPLVIIATPAHCDAFAAMLAERAGSTRADLEAAGMVTLLDARTTLDSFLVGGMPDAERFHATIGGVLAQLHARQGGRRTLRAYGEMIDLLWRAGNARAALRVEELWNELATRHAFSLFCAYVMGNFYREAGADLHSPAGTPRGPATPEQPESQDLGTLQHRAHSLELEVEHRRRLEAALRDALEARSRAQAQLESLVRIGGSLHAELALDRVVQRLTDEATAACRAAFGAFFYKVNGEHGESYVLYALAGAPRERFAGAGMPRNTPLFEATFRGEGVVRIDDVTRDPRFGHNPPYHGLPAGHLPVCSYLAAPVVSRAGEVLGGLLFGHPAPGVFTEPDERLIVAIAAHAASALENARLYEAEKKARASAEDAQRRTETLHAMTAELSRTVDAEEAARIVIHRTRAMIGAQAGAMLLLAEGEARVESFFLDGEVHAEGVAHARELGLSVDTPMSDAVRTGRLVWIVGEAEIAARYPHLAWLCETIGARTWGALPIVFEGRTLGAIWFRCNEERPVTPDEQAFLCAVARQCGQAIERARLHDATRAAQAAAEHANRAKDDFLAMLGHELRNPLSPILTAVQLMRLRGETSSSKEQNIIERQVSHLTRLVDDLLDVSRITRGKSPLDRKPVRLASVLAKALEIAGPLVEERRHQLEVSIPGEVIWLEADELRLCQVFTNLLTNAAKYTEPGGQLALTAEREGAEVVVRIRDNGIGIPAELLPRIFDLFVQGPRGPHRQPGGLGIGLALVHNLVAMHGGSVAAASDGPGQGSELIVRLPVLVLGTPSTVAPDAERSLKHRLQVVPRRILLVDDNQDAALLLGEMMESVGHEVVIAHDGPGALEAVKRFTPEVAILDIGLPVMDGYELAGALRERLGTQLPLLAITGYGQQHDRELAEQAGFVAHFVKPVGVGKLLAAIEVLP
ncbi:MAG TPA: GAF domain-containing protein [Kofleriaceae bacterium]|nr:GAF domain-containing protein [Kofleriaceae bacterium]